MRLIIFRQMKCLVSVVIGICVEFQPFSSFTNQFSSVTNFTRIRQSKRGRERLIWSWHWDRAAFTQRGPNSWAEDLFFTPHFWNWWIKSPFFSRSTEMTFFLVFSFTEIQNLPNLMPNKFEQFFQDLIEMKRWRNSTDSLIIQTANLKVQILSFKMVLFSVIDLKNLKSIVRNYAHHFKIYFLIYRWKL